MSKTIMPKKVARVKTKGSIRVSSVLLAELAFYLSHLSVILLSVYGGSWVTTSLISSYSLVLSPFVTVLTTFLSCTLVSLLALFTLFKLIMPLILRGFSDETIVKSPTLLWCAENGSKVLGKDRLFNLLCKAKRFATIEANKTLFSSKKYTNALVEHYSTSSPKYTSDVLKEKVEEAKKVIKQALRSGQKGVQKSTQYPDSSLPQTGTDKKTTAPKIRTDEKETHTQRLTGITVDYIQKIWEGNNPNNAPHPKQKENKIDEKQGSVLVSNPSADDPDINKDNKQSIEAVKYPKLENLSKHLGKHKKPQNSTSTKDTGKSAPPHSPHQTTDSSTAHNNKRPSTASQLKEYQIKHLIKLDKYSQKESMVAPDGDILHSVSGDLSPTKRRISTLKDKKEQSTAAHQILTIPPKGQLTRFLSKYEKEKKTTPDGDILHSGVSGDLSTPKQSTFIFKAKKKLSPAGVLMAGNQSLHSSSLKASAPIRKNNSFTDLKGLGDGSRNVLKDLTYSVKKRRTVINSTRKEI